MDLKRVPEAGGHVKCWERFAEVAAESPEALDLTVHFLGDEDGVHTLAENVRYITHPASLSTCRLRFMGRMPAETDLAPLNSKVLPYLTRYQVIHTTDAFFALCKTALRFARKHSLPVVNSIHTDTPSYTRVFGAQIIRRLVGEGLLRRVLLDRLRLHDRLARLMRGKLERYLGRCDWVLVSKRDDLGKVQRVLSSSRVSLLRRGVDKEAFHPRWRDRQRLQQAFGIPPEKFLLLFVGRLDEAKNVMTFAQAVRLLLERGQSVRALVVGDGSQREAVRRLLGPAVTLPGAVPQSMLPWLYASADLFVFPSQSEVCPNVVIEARASGLPVLVSSRGGAAGNLGSQGLDGLVIPEDGAASWAKAIQILRRRPGHLSSMSASARRQIETEWPSWKDVLWTDLLPVWRAVAARTASARK